MFIKLFSIDFEEIQLVIGQFLVEFGGKGDQLLPVLLEWWTVEDLVISFDDVNDHFVY